MKSASVSIDDQLISSIGRGVLCFAGIGREDTEKDVDIMAARVLKAKLWPDETNPNASVCERNAHIEPVRDSNVLLVEAKCAGYSRRNLMWLVTNAHTAIAFRTLTWD